MLGGAAQPFAVLEEGAGPLAWALLFVLVGLPAVLMGGTLPVLIRSLAPQLGRIGAPEAACTRPIQAAPSRARC